MGSAAQVYAQELGVLNHGHPMWCPEPMDQHEVRVGDVGFIHEDGQFHRLFNVTVDEDHPCNQHGVPEGFQPLSIHPRLVQIRRNHFPPGPISSNSVKTHKAEASASASDATGVVSGRLSYRFDCSTSQGAVLVLMDSAKKTFLLNSNTICSYIGKNHASWHRFATDPDQFDLILNSADIIMVRGTVKTTGWALGAYLNNGNTVHGVSFTAQAGQLGGAACEWSFTNQISTQFQHRVGGFTEPPSAISLIHDQGDSQESNKLELPEIIAERRHRDDDNASVRAENKNNQCVFLSYYRVKYRLGSMIKRVVAAAGPDNLPPPENRDSSPGIYVNSDTGSVFEIPAAPKDRTPVDDLLDYILETSDATVAVASDHDVAEILQNNHVPEDFRSFLQDAKLQVFVDAHGTGALCTEALRGKLASAEMTNTTMARLEPPSSPSVDVSRRYSPLPKSPGRASSRESFYRNTASILYDIAVARDHPRRSVKPIEQSSPIEDPLKPGIGRYSPNTYHPTGHPGMRYNTNLRVQEPYDGQEVPQHTNHYLSASSEPIATFSCKGREGVRMDLAAHGGALDLDNPSDTIPALLYFSRIQYDLHWPGYRKYSHTVEVRQTRYTTYSDRAEVVRQIAEVIQDFIEKMKDIAVEEQGKQWKVGKDGIQLENLELVGLRTYSRFSFQPVFRYRQASIQPNSTSTMCGHAPSANSSTPWNVQPSSSSVAATITTHSMPRVIKLLVIADIIDPWCYIGQRGMERAIEACKDMPISIEIEHHPYRIYPSLKNGQFVDKREWYESRFGKEKTAIIERTVTERAQQLGIQMRYLDGIITQPTLAHRLLLKAWKKGGQDRQQPLLTVLFKSYFEDSANIGDTAVLADAAVKAGLFTRDEAIAFLDSDECLDEVEAMMTEARRKGVTGVPFVVIDGKWAVSGGQTAEVYTQIFRKLAANEATASTPRLTAPLLTTGVPVTA